MTDREIDEAIATALTGWSRDKDGRLHGPRNEGACYLKQYSHSYEWCAEAREKLPDEWRLAFVSYLGQVTGNMGTFSLIDASPRDQCIAMLRAAGLHK